MASQLCARISHEIHLSHGPGPVPDAGICLWARDWPNHRGNGRHQGQASRPRWRLHDPSWGDLDLGLRIPVAPALRFGIGLGLDAIEVKINGHRGDPAQAAVVPEGGKARLSVGLPRLVMPHALDVPALGESEDLQLAAGVLAGEGIRDAILQKNAPSLRGARVDLTLGRNAIAAAMHEYDNTRSLRRQFALSCTSPAYSRSLGSQASSRGRSRPISSNSPCLSIMAG